MSPLTVGLIGVLALLAMVALRAPLGLALLIAGFGGLWKLHGLDTAVYVVSSAPVTALSSYTLSVLPLFILMGAMSVRAGLAEALYKSAYGFVGHRSGGLAVASIAACGGFGAICGSSLATVTTDQGPTMGHGGPIPATGGPRIAVGINVAESEFLVMQAIVFPGINILWIGCVLLFIGTFMAVWQRVR